MAGLVVCAGWPTWALLGNLADQVLADLANNLGINNNGSGGLGNFLSSREMK